MTDAPIQFDIKKCKKSDFAIIALRDAFLDQGFNTLTKRLETIFGVSTPRVEESKEKEKEKEKKEEKPKDDQLELL